MITSASNPRIKAARRLHRRRNRHKSGTMLIEGVRLVRDAWQSGVRPSLLFVAPGLIEENAAALALVDECEANSIEIVAVTAAVFATLTETVTPQGVAAIVPLPKIEAPHVVDFALMFDRVRDPGNAGTLLRSAEAAGVQSVIFAPDTTDPFNDKVVRAGMGAHFRLPIFVCSSWSAVEAALPSHTAIYLADADADLAYDTIDWRAPVTLIVGGEADGASPEARSMAVTVRIPMLGGAESLNASIAGAVILFEASRQRRLSRA